MMFLNWHKVMHMRLWLHLFLPMETHKSKYRQGVVSTPNYDRKINSGIQSKRGLQVSDELIKFSNLYHASTFTLSHTLLRSQTKEEVNVISRLVYRNLSR
jgi:hypothetical protein